MTNASELSIIIIWNYYYTNSLCNQVLLLEALQEKSNLWRFSALFAEQRGMGIIHRKYFRHVNQEYLDSEWVFLVCPYFN